MRNLSACCRFVGLEAMGAVSDPLSSLDHIGFVFLLLFLELSLYALLTQLVHLHGYTTFLPEVIDGVVQPPTIGASTSI